MAERELLKQALDALETTRKGSIQMRENAEEYGRRWANAYIKEYRGITAGSAEERFNDLKQLHRKLDQFAQGIAQSYDAIAAIRAHLGIADAQIAAQEQEQEKKE